MKACSVAGGVPHRACGHGPRFSLFLSHRKQTYESHFSNPVPKAESPVTVRVGMWGLVDTETENYCPLFTSAACCGLISRGFRVVYWRLTKAAHSFVYVGSIHAFPCVNGCLFLPRTLNEHFLGGARYAGHVPYLKSGLRMLGGRTVAWHAEALCSVTPLNTIRIDGLTRAHQQRHK